MKFTSNQLIAILAIVVAGIILAHVFAPTAAAAVISIATTIVGTLFVTRRKDDDQDPPAGAGTGGGLKVIAGGLSAFMLVVSLVGCGASFSDLEDAANNGDDKAKIALCRGEARAAFYVEKKSEAEALARFDACIARKADK